MLYGNSSLSNSTILAINCVIWRELLLIQRLLKVQSNVKEKATFISWMWMCWIIHSFMLNECGWRITRTSYTKHFIWIHRGIHIIEIYLKYHGRLVTECYWQYFNTSCVFILNNFLLKAESLSAPGFTHQQQYDCMNINKVKSSTANSVLFSSCSFQSSCLCLHFHFRLTHNNTGICVVH